MGKGNKLHAGLDGVLGISLGVSFNTLFLLSISDCWVHRVTAISSPYKPFMEPSLWLGSPLVVHVTVNLRPEPWICSLGFSHRAPLHPWPPIQTLSPNVDPQPPPVLVRAPQINYASVIPLFPLL